MNIISVKERKDSPDGEITGYLVNDTMSVPVSQGNRHYIMVQEWIAKGNTPENAFNVEELAAYNLRIAKEQRKEDVAAITVTVDGMEFDGDEVSQGRMARAVASSDPGESTQWKLANNTVVTVTHEQLKQALRVAGEVQTALWMV